jgi:SSS family solute:Na+ symporter
LDQTEYANALNPVDWVILIVYFGFMIWLGTRFAKRQTSTDRYFLGKGRLPGWAVGLSMFATIISSWAFIALPGKSFKDDLQYLMVISTLPVSTMLAVRFLIPLFRNKIRLSAYEYLERRFGMPARVYGNLAFIIVHFGKMGAILYLLSLAITSMTGWNIFVVIGFVGLATMIYTLFGGIEGVVWSDVIQGILLLGGGIISFLFLLFTVPGGAENIFKTAMHAQKLKLISTGFDWGGTGFIVFLCFGLNFYMQKYASDQTVVQRYLLSRSTRQSAKALWTSSLLIMFVWILFMGIGALLWAFYRIQPGLLPAGLWNQPDRIFPYFIGHQLPAGITGIILAGLMAATMSTLSSDLNSLASILADDYYSKLNKDKTDKQKLLFSRVSVLVSGILAVLLASAMTRIHSMADAAFNFVSLVAGGVLGMYMLGLFTRRCSNRGLYSGIGTGVLFILWATFSNVNRTNPLSWLPRFPLHTLWIGLLGNCVVFISGLLFSAVLSPKYRAGDTYTVFASTKSRRRM